MDVETFKQALSHLSAGVSVITTRTPEGRLVGFTATSFTSLSLSPPLVLFCLGEDATALPAFEAAEGFAVNLLTRDQQAISDAFAARAQQTFPEVNHAPGRRGVPLLTGSLAILECRTTQRYPGGDHRIFIGEVEEAHVGSGAPLLYYRRAYHTL